MHINAKMVAGLVLLAVVYIVLLAPVVEGAETQDATADPVSAPAADPAPAAAPVADPVLAAAATPAPDAVASGDAETAGRIEMTAAQQYTLKTVMAALKPAIDIAKASAAAVAAAAAARAAAEDGTEPAAAAPPLNTDANEAIEFALAVISDIDIADPALHSVVEDASVSAGEKLIRIDTLVSRYNTYLTNTYMDPQFMSAAVVQL